LEFPVYLVEMDDEGIRSLTRMKRKKASET